MYRTSLAGTYRVRPCHMRRGVLANAMCMASGISTFVRRMDMLLWVVMLAARGLRRGMWLRLHVLFW
jgi:hypothetical protein